MSIAPGVSLGKHAPTTYPQAPEGGGRRSIPNIPLVIFHVVLPQEIQEFFPETDYTMMRFLSSNVRFHTFDTRVTDRKSPISLLPTEAFHIGKRLVYPARGVCFQYSYRITYGDIAIQTQEQMGVIGVSTCRAERSTILSNNPTEVVIDALSVLWWDEGKSVFGAEYDVIVEAGK